MAGIFFISATLPYLIGGLEVSEHFARTAPREDEEMK